MAEPTREELLESIASIEAELVRFRGIVEKIVPEKEWYSTREFAIKKGLKHKTICNYVGRGKYDRTRKNPAGHTEIHKSELEK